MEKQQQNHDHDHGHEESMEHRHGLPRRHEDSASAKTCENEPG